MERAVDMLASSAETSESMTRGGMEVAVFSDAAAGIIMEEANSTTEVSMMVKDVKDAFLAGITILVVMV